MRLIQALTLNLLVCPILGAAPFGFGQVRERAQALSREPFHAPTARVPESLLRLKYEQYQSIHFKHDHALWANEKLPFQVEFFLPGYFHKQTVLIHEVSDRDVRKIPFSTEAFTFGTNRIELTPDTEYAGFRIIHSGTPVQEIAAFLDASYFRMVGWGQVFGATARGLALNTTALGKEEFPVFREFWLLKPERGDATLTVWALMDSPSVSGAFEFVTRLGATTVTQTKAAFFPRVEVKEFGMAALTSMFLHDQNSHPPNADFRPSVHDSDGLSLHTGRV
jgi:glucans biosynthesis protein